jgi:hypothetical protein
LMEERSLKVFGGRLHGRFSVRIGVRFGERFAAIGVPQWNFMRKKN